MRYFMINRSLFRFSVVVFMALAAVFAGVSSSALAADEIVWGKPSEVLSTDPHTSGSGTSWVLYYLVYETLTGTDDKLGIVPRLAESWDNPNSTTYIFHLRKSAAFSNGRPLVASDVVESFRRLRDPELGSTWGKSLADVKSITAVDDHTVRFELSVPFSPLTSVLAVTTTAILPMKEIKEGTFDPTKEMMGSGPYMVAEHLQDQAWILKANPHYGRPGLPKVDNFEVRIIPDDAARIAALRDGRVQIASFEIPDAPLLLKGVRNVETIVQQTPNFFRLDVSAIQQDSPFTDLRVRKAMSLALDRKLMVDIVFGGQSTIDCPVPNAFGYNACSDLPSYALPRNERLAKAKALLKEAKAENIKATIIASPVLVTYPLIAQVIQKNLADIGIKLEIEQVPPADWYARVFSPETDFHLAMSWFAGYTDPSLVMRWWNPNSAGWNAGFLKPVEAYNELLVKINKLPNGPARMAAMIEAATIIDEQANMLALVNKPDYISYRKDLIHARFSPIEGNFNTFKYLESFTLNR
jgi:peptide/nickel transport system substrate-binding protein